MLTQEYEEAKNRLVSYVEECRDFAERNANKEKVRALDSLVRELKELTFNIALIGGIKRGKSTLVNALLGRKDDDLSPVAETICTSAITKYRNYPDDMPEKDRVPHALVTYESRPGDAVWMEYGELRGLISQECNENNCKGIRLITVYGDFPCLGSCCLVDTPGTGACIERHSEMVADFLPSVDAIIMPVSDPMDNDEQMFLHGLAEGSRRRVFYVITRADKISDDEVEAIRQDTLEKIADADMPRPKHIYVTCAKNLFDALCSEADGDELERIRTECGLRRLENDLSSFITENSCEGRNLSNRLRLALSTTTQYLVQRRNDNNAFIEMQDGDRERILAEIDAARSGFADCTNMMKRKLSRFARDWEHAVEYAMSQLELRKDPIEDRLRDRFGRAGYFSSLKNAFTLSSVIAQIVSPEIAKVAYDLDSKLSGLIQKLNEDFEEECALYAKRVSGGTPVAASLAVLGTGGAAGATIGLVTIPAVQSVLGALGSLSVALGEAGAAPFTGGVIKFLGGMLFGGKKMVELAASVKAAYLGLTGALSCAVVPVAIGAVSMYAAGPLSRLFVSWRIPSHVEQAVREGRAHLQKQLLAAQTAVENACNQWMEDKQSELDARIGELQRRVQELRPEDKARAESENRTIGKLLSEGDGVVLSIKHIS